ncbi:MAG: aminotransferase, partial [Pseudomonadales bacterium]|nr:aminotransferase [Pseudomonadales bacterium]
KSFNIAGLMLSSLVVSHAPSQQAINQVLHGLHLGNSNPFSIVAFEAAYAHGADWLNAVLGYLQANRDFALDFIAQHCPRLSAISPQGTYLLWLNCQQLGLNNQQLRQLFTHQAKVALNAGDTFGEVGSGFMRLNFALPRVQLEEALGRIGGVLGKE